ncbi:hypothetical protein M3N55_09475 [Roseibaca sp. V10]|uniref:Uncharacterized protein n=1 Tax=Roseinatronobacter domitianus TaxID=2940293 RepID=A0ABT0M271_9RHOB|nr:hypothetical protein [Roseibaca domitiana]MCL1628959.1 hypothetical protein [Roseibaca domitiana]
MSTLKVIEVLAESEMSFGAAQNAPVENGTIASYLVNTKVSSLRDDDGAQ